jgi:hypothetical protein
MLTLLILIPKLSSFEENQKCTPCDLNYSKSTDVEYTADGNYACSTLLLILDGMSMNECVALKSECVICVEIEEIRNFVLQIIQSVAIQGGAEFVDQNSYQSKALARTGEQEGIAILPPYKIIQYYALHTIYSVTHSVGHTISESEGIPIPPRWNNSQGWESTYIDPCDGWSGIECQDDLVTVIDLYSK